MDDWLYKIAITLIPKVGPVTAKSLIGYCGGAEAVFSASKRELLAIPGVGPQIVASVRSSNIMQKAEAEIKFIEKYGITPLFYLDQQYPGRLKHFNDAPVLLYYKGTADLNTSRTVAIVGTRKPSVQGLAICEELVAGLQPYDVTIISGLAFGIDAKAHRLRCMLTYLLLVYWGTAYDIFYPSQHRRMAERMMEKGGVLTEYISSTAPEREHFPMRNRIVAGLCDALIVVETARKGGSMITARIANSYNRDVFAVPGRVHDRMSEGCNLLIKSHRAALIDSAQDIAYVMRWEETTAGQGVQTRLFVELTEEEQRIIDLFANTEEVGIDQLTFESGMVNSTLATNLLNLEFKGVVRSLPGKRYVLLQRR